MARPDKKARKLREARGRDPEPAEKPISLHPLKFEEAVKDLLTVKPDNVGRSKGEKNADHS